ncbi:MAG: zinc-ribbon domain containing protein [Planctomycetota bacterium]
MAGKQLKCVECGSDFIFTDEEQEFHRGKGYTNEPKRCPSCRQIRRKSVGGGGGYQTAERVRTEVTCADCGQTTTVPFKPRMNKPVYCDACFAKNRTSNA